MHHEIRGVFGDVELLQQEAAVARMQVGEIVRRPADLEAEVAVVALRQLEIARRHEGLDLDGLQIHGRSSPARGPS